MLIQLCQSVISCQSQIVRPLKSCSIESINNPSPESEVEHITKLYLRIFYLTHVLVPEWNGHLNLFESQYVFVWIYLWRGHSHVKGTFTFERCSHIEGTFKCAMCSHVEECFHVCRGRSHTGDADVWRGHSHVASVHVWRGHSRVDGTSDQSEIRHFLIFTLVTWPHFNY